MTSEQRKAAAANVVAIRACAERVRRLGVGDPRVALWLGAIDHQCDALDAALQADAWAAEDRPT